MITQLNLHVFSCLDFCLLLRTYIEFYDPEHGDEQEVKGDKEAEGPPHVRDAFLLSGFVRLHPHRHGCGVDRPREPPDRQLRIAAVAALAVHL